MNAAVRALELILARNFLASLSTAAFLVDRPGRIVFYNEAAGELLGRPFELAGEMGAEEWTRRYGPFGPDGAPLPFDELALTRATRESRAAHAEFTIRSEQGVEHDIEATAFPVVGAEGFHGAVVMFWPREGV